MYNYDEARREIYYEMSDCEEAALVYHDAIAMEELERLRAELDQLYIEAEKDHWEWETID